MSYFWSQIFIEYIFNRTVSCLTASQFGNKRWMCDFLKMPKSWTAPQSAESRSVRRVTVSTSVCQWIHLAFSWGCVVWVLICRSWMSFGVWSYSVKLLMQHEKKNLHSETQLKSFITKCQDLISPQQFGLKWRVYVCLQGLRGASQWVFTYEKQQPVRFLSFQWNNQPHWVKTPVCV